MRYIKDKNILVTGGTGTFGQGIVRRLLDYEPAVVRVFSRDEDKQHQLLSELGGFSNIRFFIGDVRDKDRLYRAMEDVDIVFHAAAMKHVYLCEYNPFEAVKTNVMGTQNVIDVALERGVSKVLFTSSDKATSPTNAMGASKLLAEKLITAANFYRGKKKTIFASVRFGNVIGSRGSAIHTFLKQIKEGGPVTITDSRMTRYIMSQSQAVDLVLKAADMATGGEVFVLKMEALEVRTLINVLIRKYAPHFGHDPADISVIEVGAKAGEKLYEELLSEDEKERAFETDNMFIIPPSFREFLQEAVDYPNAREARNAICASRDAELLSEVEIERLLDAQINHSNETIFSFD